MIAHPEQLLKARDVASMLGLSIDTVLDHFEAGELPGFRLYGRKGGPVRFRLSELDDWLDHHCRPERGTVTSIAKSPAAPKRPGHDTGGDRSSAGRILRDLDSEGVEGERTAG